MMDSVSWVALSNDGLGLLHRIHSKKFVVPVLSNDGLGPMAFIRFCYCNNNQLGHDTDMNVFRDFICKALMGEED
jgi:hypothetical protein